MKLFKVDTIEWHENNLMEDKKLCADKIREFVSLKNEVLFLEKQISFYEYQIKEAKKDKKEEFDKDSYRIKERKKYGIFNTL